MQEPNNENTLPIRPDRGPEKTAPTRVSTTPVDPSSVEETRAVSVNPRFEAQPPVPPAAKPRRPRRWPFVVVGILLVFLLGGAGGWVGYQSAIQMRKAKMQEQRVETLTEQFMLGLVAQGNKQYEIARQHFEYVIKQDPNFPGAQDKLREVMIASAVINTPTPLPTEVVPTLTPTVDTRPQEEIFNQAKAQYAARDWAGMFTTVDALRKIDPTFHAVEIDGMLYFALRFRGIDKILHEANLEGGLYDLALAEQFGPLDVDSKGYRNWARLYLNGASFWEVDWVKVMEYFEQIYPYFPNMRDSSGLTAVERYRIAARSQGDKLREQGDNCKAYEYYQLSLNAVADGGLEQTATAVYLACHPATSTATITPTGLVTTVVPVETTEVPVATTEVPPVATTEVPPATTGTATTP